MNENSKELEKEFIKASFEFIEKTAELISKLDLLIAKITILEIEKGELIKRVNQLEAALFEHIQNDIAHRPIGDYFKGV